MPQALPLIGSASAPGADGRSPTGLPGTYLDFGGPFDYTTSPPTQLDRVDEGGNVIVPGSGWGISANPVAGCPTESVRTDSYGLGGTECAYDFAPLYDAIPAMQRTNFLVNGEYRLSEMVTAYGEFRTSRNVTEVRNGAAPAFFQVSGAAFLAEVDAQLGTSMATSPYVYMARRSVDAGPRATDNTNTAFSTVLGGRVTFNNDMELDINFHNVESEMNRVGVGGQLSRTALTAAVVNGVLDPRETYDPAFYAANGISIATQRQAVGTENSINVQLTGLIGSTDIGFAVGGRYKEDSFRRPRRCSVFDGRRCGWRQLER